MRIYVYIIIPLAILGIILSAILAFDHYDPNFLFNFPHARKTSTKKALSLLRDGTKMLFDKKHQFMIAYSIDFFAKRIGAHRFFKS